MKKFFAKAKQTIGTVEITEESQEFQQMEEQLKDTTVFYKDTLAVATKMKASELACAQPLTDFANSLNPAGGPAGNARASANNMDINNNNNAAAGGGGGSNANNNAAGGKDDNSIIEESMKKFADAERQLAAQRTILSGYVNDELIAPITAQLDQIKQLKALRRKMEDARIEYDSIRANHAKGSATDSELEKAKKLYETLRTQTTQKMSDIEYQRSSSLVHNLASLMKAQKKFFEESLKVMQDLEPLLQQVDEQVPKGAEDEEGSLQVELNLLRLQRTPVTIMESIESSVRQELQFLEESGRATGTTKEAKLAKVLQDKLNSMSGS